MNVEFKDSRLVKFGKIYVYIFFLDTVNLWLMLGTFHKAGLVLFMHTQSSSYTMCSKGLFFLFKLPWVTWDNQMVFRNRIQNGMAQTVGRISILMSEC